MSGTLSFYECMLSGGDCNQICLNFLHSSCGGDAKTPACA